MIVSLDFETRSLADLRECGAHRYAEDPSTDVWCCAWRVDEGPVDLWVPGDPFPFRDLPGHVFFWAWNCEFERVVWAHVMTRRYGWPECPPVERWRDTMAAAASLALPHSLEKCARVLGAGEKDMDGRWLMLQMARPRRVEDDGTVVWWDVEEKRERIYQYCRQDVEVESRIARMLGDIPSGFEREVWETDQRINDRGVALDLDLVRAAQAVVEAETERVNVRLWHLTEGQVPAVTDHTAILHWMRDMGVRTSTVKRAYLERLVGHLEEAAEDLGEGAARVLEVAQLRLAAGRTSTGKLNRMLHWACRDGRARGLLRYFGAGTGRWSGNGIQPQNFPRGEVDVTPALVAAILTGDPDAVREHGDPLVVVSSALRAMLVPGPGRVFYGADYSAIEAVVLAWLAGEESILDSFRRGEKPYDPMAQLISERTGMDASYALGKVTILGGGYQMGGGTFQRHAAGFGVELTEEQAHEIIYDVYRPSVPAITELWSRLQAAALEAVRHPGREVSVGRLQLQRRGWFLWMRLPGGRELAYADPAVVQRRMPWDPNDVRPGVQVWNVDSVTRQWSPRSLYGGLLTENATQAVARDILAHALVQLEEHETYTPVLTVHDEILCEGPPDGDVDEVIEIMTTRLPEWARGCPVAAAGWSGDRYRKD